MHTDVETKCAAKAARVRHMSREDETSLLDLHVNAEEICKNRQIGVNMKEIMELVRYTKNFIFKKTDKMFYMGSTKHFAYINISKLYQFCNRSRC